ncbi:MAG TPA: WXG100 family type VII secretion target [Micromonosporaceae bacterium]|jgi:WXG100 family type VII secretion target|nr:WXG100 family type VII secretion target [Micromonosporaceae bacterium]
MAEPTAAEWASLKDGANQCTTSSQAIDTAVRNMLNQLEGIQWRGSARVAFDNAKTNVQADAKTIVERLEAIANGINKTSSSLMATDEDARASLDGVAGGTGATGIGGGDISAGLRG